MESLVQWRGVIDRSSSFNSVIQSTEAKAFVSETDLEKFIPYYFSINGKVRYGRLTVYGK